MTEDDREAARQMVRRALQSEETERGVYALAARDGRLRAVAWSGKALAPSPRDSAVLLTGQDVTDLQEAQRQALQAERLATIGLTMAGLAQEGRNALQRGHACLERLRWKLNDRPEEIDLVRLFNDVQGYAAPINLDLAGWHLDEVWREVWDELALRRSGRDAVLRESKRADVFCVADRFRLKQVFRNIFENSLEVCTERVQIEITYEETEIDGYAAGSRQGEK